MECAGVEAFGASRSQKKDTDIPSKHIAAHFIVELAPPLKVAHRPKEFQMSRMYSVEYKK